jgi:hypothetical protein
MFATGAGGDGDVGAQAQCSGEAEHGARGETLLLAEVREVQRLVAALPERDTRPAEEVLGHDTFGLPG